MPSKYGHMVQAELMEEIRRLLRDRDMAMMELATRELVADDPAASETRSLTPDSCIEMRQGDAVYTAHGEWLCVVKEPKGKGWKEIDKYIRGAAGLTWPSVETGPNARPGIPYTRNGQFAWCGAFVAYCWGRAGLKREIRRKVLPSTYRLRTWAKHNGRMVNDLSTLRPGDVAVVGSASSKYGAHIVLIEERTKGKQREYLTIEGNAKGRGPGRRGAYEGVVKRARSLDSDRPTDRVIMYAVRFTMDDMAKETA